MTSVAQEIMDTTPCPYCGAPAGGRCKALRKGGNPNDPYNFTWLTPANSHTVRHNAYWGGNRARHRIP